MKRRNFLKTSALISGAAGTVPAMVSCSPDPKKPAVFLDEIPEKTLLDELENEHLLVRYFSDASAEIVDKSNRLNWDMLPVAWQEYGGIDDGYVWHRKERSLMEQYPGRFILEKKNGQYEYTLYGRLGALQGKFSALVRLEGKELVFKVIKISGDLPSLVFPPAIDCDSLVLPSGIGTWLKKKEPDRYFRRFLTFFIGLNMRWIGGLKDRGGWMCIFDEGWPDAGAMVVNNLAAPGMLRSLGEWSHGFTFRYRFIKGNYVQLAKEYRKYAIEKNIFRSLKDKITATPELSKFKGGRLLSFYLGRPGRTLEDARDYWYNHEMVADRVKEGLQVRFTYKQVHQALEQARNLGFTQGPVVIRGWIKGGYDASHPDVWPPEPAFGTEEELKELVKSREGIVAGLHDNYQDMYAGYPSFPKGINILENGEYMAGGFWAGGQAYILNSRDSVRYARGNWEKIKTLDPQLMFVDTTTASRMLQSCEKGNELTRRQDFKLKSELMKVYKDAGRIFGSEEVADFGIPYADWFENRHARIPGESIPLWPLVFHDAAFCSRYRGAPEEGHGKKRFMADMLWGYHLLFSIPPGWKDDGYFSGSFYVDQWHREIGTSEMLHHEYPGEDYRVERTVFAPGRSIVCNFSDRDRLIEGKMVRSGDYLIE